MYRVFISHSWAYSSQYDKIESFLSQENVSYYNHSVPKDAPIHTNGSDQQLRPIGQKSQARDKRPLSSCSKLKWAKCRSSS